MNKWKEEEKLQTQRFTINVSSFFRSGGGGDGG